MSAVFADSLSLTRSLQIFPVWISSLDLAYGCSNGDPSLAFAEAAKVFISYVSTTANDICKEGKRQTISADDVIKAMEELEFNDMVPQLREYLEGDLNSILLGVAWGPWEIGMIS